MIRPPLFSIIVPAYNYGHLLSRAIESVLQQSRDDWDLTVINDGSTDNTNDVVNSLLNKGHSFSYIEQANSGLASTRNNGIQISKGQYLIFLDADDEMMPGALEHFRQAIHSSPSTAMFIGGHISVLSSGKFKSHIPTVLKNKKGLLKSYLLDKSLTISNGATAMRRDIFDRYLYPEDFKSTEDIPMFSFVLANYPIETVPDNIIYIHKHDNSLRHNTSHAKNIGMQLVDEVFSEQRIPIDYQWLKKPYASQRALSLFRTFYLANDYTEARKYYLKAIQIMPKSIFRTSYLRKFIHTLKPKWHFHSH